MLVWSVAYADVRRHYAGGVKSSYIWLNASCLALYLPLLAAPLVRRTRARDRTSAVLEALDDLRKELASDRSTLTSARCEDAFRRYAVPDAVIEAILGAGGEQLTYADLERRLVRETDRLNRVSHSDLSKILRRMSDRHSPSGASRVVVVAAGGDAAEQPRSL